MAFKGVLSVVFVCLFGLGSAKYCNSDDSCSSWQECCSNNRCQDSCYSSRYSCSYDYQCGVGYECCGNGKCSSVCSYYWSAGSITGSVIGTIVFFAISISIVSCFCCSCCPYYRHRRSRNVVTVAQPGQAFVSAVVTTQSSQQQMQQYPPPRNYPPPPGNYNQPPPGNYNQPPPGNYNEPPPEYPGISYPQNPAPQRFSKTSPSIDASHF